MNTSNSDHDLNQQDDNVKRAYHSAVNDEPRAIIDDAIRAAARRAVSSQPSSIKKTWLNRWTTPLAAAATVMLTSSVIFMAVRDRPEVAPSIADMMTTQKLAKIAPSESVKDVAAAPVLESGVANKRAEGAEGAKGSEPPEAAASAPTMATQPQISPAPAKVITPPAALAKATPTATPIAPPAAPSIAAQTVLKQMKAEVASDLRAQDTSRKKQGDREATAALTAEATGKVMPPLPATVNVAGASSVAPSPPQTRMLAASQIATEPTKPRAELTTTAATTAPPVAAAAPTPPPALDTIEKSPALSRRAVTTAAEKSDKIESADAWIKRMSELKRQEKNKELADEITRFRKRYPSVELPKELTEAPN